MKSIILLGIWSSYSIALSILFFFGLSFSKFLFLFLLPIVTAMIIKIVLECRRYGKEKVLQFQFKGTPTDRYDVFLNSLQSQMNSQVFTAEKNDRMIFIVNTNGCYLYYLIQNSGILLEQENSWYIKEGKKVRKIENPVKKLEHEKSRIEEKLGRSVESFIVLDSHTLFQKGNKEYPIVPIAKSPFYLCKVVLLKPLEEKEIVKIVEDITQKLDYHSTQKRTLKEEKMLD